MEYISTIIQTIQAGLSDFGSVHPLIVHFPIALLSIAPIFLIISIVLKENRKQFLLASLLIIFIGTMGVWKSTWSGEEAGEAVKTYLSAEAQDVLNEHDEIAHTTKSIYFALLGIFIVYIASLKWSSVKFNRTTHTIFLTAYTIAFCAGLVVLMNAAHKGGELVHKYKVTTTLFDSDH